MQLYHFLLLSHLSVHGMCLCMVCGMGVSVCVQHMYVVCVWMVFGLQLWVSVLCVCMVCGVCVWCMHGVGVCCAYAWCVYGVCVVCVVCVCMVCGVWV